MNTMSSLSNLPKDIFRNNIIPAITVHELGVFDTSLTNENLRSTYLASVRNFDFDKLGYKGCMTTAMLEWVRMRKFKLKEVKLGLANDNRSAYALQKFPELKRIQICGEFLVHHCPRDVDLDTLRMEERLVQTIDASKCKDITNKFLLIMSQNCLRLQHICLNGCHNISDSSLQQIIRSNRFLEYLDIGGCKKITDGVLKDISGSTRRLKYLNISGLSITEEGLYILIKKCTYLEILFLDNCPNVTDSTIKSISQSLHKIKNLSLRGCKLTDHSILFICESCPALESLDVSGEHSTITDTAIIHLAHSCAHLTHLNLEGCSEITNSSLIVLSQQCPKLISLDLGNTNISSEGLQALSKLSSQFIYLSLHDTTNISEKQIKCFLTKCIHLEYFDASFCTYINDDCMISLITKSPQLKVLKIRNSNITDATIVTIAKILSKIEELDITYCVGVSDLGILALSQGCPKLKKLEYEGCDTTDFSADILKEALLLGK